MTRFVDVTTSFLATFATLGRGLICVENTRQPEKTLILYDIEGCPYCRLVREVLTQLDIDVLIRPCPKGGKRFRSEAIRLGGKSQFPFLVDPNTDIQKYESHDISVYLFREYGDGNAPGWLNVKTVRTLTSMWATGLRRVQGTQAKPSKPPEEPLELFSFDCSPYARLVREILCEMEIPFITRNVGRTQWQDHILPFMRDKIAPNYQPNQRNRRRLVERTGKVSVPYLIDPNTSVEMFESKDIINYLQTSYAAG